MALRFCAVRPEEENEVRGFLASVFQVSIDAVFLNARLFQWKYFDPRPDWTGPRSWVLKNDERIVAHVGTWPLRFLTPRGPIDFVHPLDWAADSEYAGAGVLLVRSYLQRSGNVLGLGGSDQARPLLPSLGFADGGEVEIFSKSILPWRFRTTTSIAATARSARLFTRKLGKQLSQWRHTGWSAEAVDVFPRRLGELIEKAAIGEHAFLWHTIDTLNFILQCPIQSCRGHLLYKNGDLRGYFILARPGNQTRVADLRVDSLEPRDWTSAYSVALESARDDPEAHEITAFCSTDLVRNALGALGFQQRGSRTIRLYDKRKLLAGTRCQIQSIASDSFFLFNPRKPYP